MRKSIAALGVLLLSLLATPLPSFADPYVDNALIDELLAELATARSEGEADEISTQIWREWFSPNDLKLSTRMSVATNLLGEGDPLGALTELTHVVEEYPDYAEGWNQRATLYFRLGRYEESLADIERVLAIEPRHYGAMAGRVLIYIKQDRHDDALRQMREALAIHPYLSERLLFPELPHNLTHV